MSDEKHETVADVVREMRNGRIPQHRHDDELLRKFADRIEAADHRFREVTKMIPHEEVAAAKMEANAPTGEKSSAVGDVAAMREALEFAEYELCAHGLFVASNLVKSALSAPPRNCDVGTADAQVSRYNKFCMQRACSECPFYVASDLLACGVRWAQMTYEEA